MSFVMKTICFYSGEMQSICLTPWLSPSTIQSWKVRQRSRRWCITGHCTNLLQNKSHNWTFTTSVIPQMLASKFVLFSSSFLNFLPLTYMHNTKSFLNLSPYFVCILTIHNVLLRIVLWNSLKHDLILIQLYHYSVIKSAWVYPCALHLRGFPPQMLGSRCEAIVLKLLTKAFVIEFLWV